MTLFELLSQTNSKGIPESLVLKIIDINDINESSINEIYSVWNDARGISAIVKDEKLKIVSEAISAFTKAKMTEKQIEDGKKFDNKKTTIFTSNGPVSIPIE